MSVSARTFVPSERAPSTIFVGLDVHKESVTIAVLPSDAAAPTTVDKLPYDLTTLRRYLETLGPAETLRTCYAASGVGYVLQRELATCGIACTVIAPSLIPTKPGVQRKHDKYDASQLARLFRAGELTAVHIPTEAEERVRDLVRCRSTFQRELLKSRHYVLKFLACRGLVYREGTPWRQPHYEWLRRLARADSSLTAEDRIVFGEYLALLEYKLSRRDELDRQIAALALTPALAPKVARLQCFRGLDTHGAMVLATELADWRRFGSARELMAYFGLVPREHSSGDRQRRGSITKAGNSHVRHVLVQAAWSYRFAPESRRRTHTATGRPGSARDRARVESATSRAQSVSAIECRAPAAGGGRRRRAQVGRIPVGRHARRAGADPRGVITPLLLRLRLRLLFLLL